MRGIFKRVKPQPLFPALVMSLSAICCFLLYSYFNWSQGYWSVISVAAITQLYINKTLLKMLLRIIGTFLGAATAYYAVQLLSPNYLLLVFFFGLFFATLFTLALRQYRYVMIITGLTFTLVIAAGITHTVQEMAIIRTYEVIIGCVTCAVISFALTYFFPQNKEGAKKEKLRFTFNPGMLAESFIVSSACFLTFLTWHLFQYPFGFWAPVTCLFVLEESMGKTMKNGEKRILAHILVSLFAGGVAFFIPSSHIVIVIPLAIGFAIIGYCLGVKNWLSEIANTMGVAWAIMLLVDDPTMSQIEIVLARFFNVVYGVTVAFLVIYLSNRVQTYWKKAL